jgi:cobaltochelatase CobS
MAQATVNSTLDLTKALKSLGGKPSTALSSARFIQPGNITGKDQVWIPPSVEQKIRLAVASGRHMWLYGPPGTGKSTILMSILKNQTGGVLGKDYYRFTMDASKTADDLVGVLGPNDNGGFHHAWSSLIDACEQGKPCVIDEINAIRAEHAFPLFSMLDHTEEFDALLAGKTRHVKKAKGFQVLATANDNGTGDNAHLFGGIEVINRALAERFAYYIHMDYLPKDWEVEMLMEKCGVNSKELITGLVDIATETRKVAKDDSSRAELAISPRVLIEWLTAYELVIKNNLKLDHVGLAEMAVTGRLSTSVRDTIIELVQNKFGRLSIGNIPLF